MKSQITFKAYGALWLLDADDRLKVAGKKETGHRMKSTLQILIDPHQGHHTPSRMILDRALGDLIDFEIVEHGETSEPESDLLLPE